MGLIMDDLTVQNQLKCNIATAICIESYIRDLATIDWLTYDATLLAARAILHDGVLSQADWVEAYLASIHGGLYSNEETAGMLDSELARSRERIASIVSRVLGQHDPAEKEPFRGLRILI